MPRRREVPKREILPDPKFHNQEVAKFMNVIMQAGKKSVAERIVYGALDHIQKGGQADPLEVFNTALSNVRPLVEVKSRRVGRGELSSSCGGPTFSSQCLSYAVA
jgi:small subunit ribosomal protein S7